MLARTRVAQFGTEHVIIAKPSRERTRLFEARVANVAECLLTYLRGQFPHCQLQSCFRAFKLHGNAKLEEMHHILRIMGWQVGERNVCVQEYMQAWPIAVATKSEDPNWTDSDVWANITTQHKQRRQLQTLKMIVRISV